MQRRLHGTTIFCDTCYSLIQVQHVPRVGVPDWAMPLSD